MMRRPEEDPLDFTVEEAGLPPGAGEDLRAIRAVRERLGETQWRRLMFWERAASRSTYLFLAIPLLLLITVLGAVSGDIHPLALLQRPSAAWDTGDWVLATAWATGVVATLLGGLARLAIGAMLRRVAAQAKSPEMDVEAVVARADAARLFEEARSAAEETRARDQLAREWAETGEGEIASSGLPAEAVADIEAARAARALVPREEWERLLRLQRVVSWVDVPWGGNGERSFGPLVFLVAAIGPLLHVLGQAFLRRRVARTAGSPQRVRSLLRSLELHVFLQNLQPVGEPVAQWKAWRAAAWRLWHDKWWGPPWWRVELSGAHVVWWLSLVVALSSPSIMRWSPDGGLVGAAWGVLIGGIMWKWLTPWLGNYLVAQSPQTKLAMRRYYRWWGRGIWPIAVLGLCAFCGCGASEANREPSQMSAAGLSTCATTALSIRSATSSTSPPAPAPPR